MAIYRLATADTARQRWRKVLPALWLALSILCFNSLLELLKQRYLLDHGPPRRYYSWDADK